jgi:uncharacterized protein (TIRG00374 family)
MHLAIIPVIAIAVLAIFLYFSSSPNSLRPVLDRLLRLVQPLIKLVQRQANVEAKENQFLEEYRLGFRKMLASKPHVALAFVVSFADWSCGVVVLWVALLGLNVYVPFSAVAITVAIGETIQMIPIDVPGTLGIYEASITATLSLFSIPVAVGASAALLARVVTSLLELPITGAAAYRYGFEVRDNRTAPLQTYATR